jgi:hypothetical protein
MALMLVDVSHHKEDAMFRSPSIHILCFMFVAATLLAGPLQPDQAQAGERQEKLKVLYHVDGKDPEVAKSTSNSSCTGRRSNCSKRKRWIRK